MKRGLKINIILMSLVFFIVVVTAYSYTYLAAKNHLDKVLQTIHLSFLNSLGQYQHALRNSRWPAQRSEILLSKNKSFTAQNIVEIQMLQLSFGFNYEYFLLRTFGKKTRVELKRGGLMQKKSPIFITGENSFYKENVGFFLRSCQISTTQYLCLIDIPVQRDFVPIQERNYTVIALPIKDTFLKAKHITWYDQWFFAHPNIKIILEKTPYLILGDNTKLDFLSYKKKIDEGIYLEGSYSIYTITTRTIILILVVTSIVLLFFLVANYYIQKRIKLKINQTITNSKLEHYNQIQTLIKGVIHDIKSPLAALKSLSQVEDQLEKQTLLNHIIKRMHMIIQDLDIKEKSFGGSEKISLPLKCVLNLSVKEKSREIDQGKLIYENNHPEVWTSAPYSEFMRMMSNLINNAFEASPPQSQVRINSSILNKDKTKISIQDYGIGIPEEKLTEVFKENVTFGKKGGTGFGLYHAKKLVESLGGEVFIESQVNQGTTINIIVPSIQTPTWAIDKLNLKNINKLFIIDDEESIFQLWKKRLEPYRIDMIYHPHPSHLNGDLENQQDYLVLLDNTFGSHGGLGLKYLEDHKIKNCILVTSDWAVKEVQENVSRLNIGLLGKDFIDQIEVSL